MSSFGEVLKSFKEKEAPESLVALIDNQKLREGLAAWQSVKCEIKCDGAECPTESSSLEKWEWMWSKVKPSLQTFSIVSGVPTHEANALYERLRALRLIYPDGEINSLAKQFLQGLVMKQLPKRKKTE